MISYHLTQIVSTEWGAFSNGLPLTDFDRDMDAGSINPGEQVYILCPIFLINYITSAVSNLMKTDI